MSRIKDEPVTSLAFCWRLERPDGGGLALTSHDAPIRIGDEICLPSPGMMPAAVIHRLDLEPSSTEIDGALSSDALSEADLAVGRWDGARACLRACDWRDPDATVIELAQGELADVATRGEGFTAELRGAAWRLNEPVCPSTSPHCRAEFGDRTCQVDLSGRTVRASVVAWDGTEVTLDRSLDDRFLFGRLRYLSGALCGLDTVMLGIDGAGVRVRDLPKADVEPGAIVEVREGCDKRLETCAARFANAANFRGEPHLPGMDLLTRYPGA
jgi:uncharacterized phage protein (TIGR02218 family)